MLDLLLTLLYWGAWFIAWVLGIIVVVACMYCIGLVGRLALTIIAWFVNYLSRNSD